MAAAFAYAAEPAAVPVKTAADLAYDAVREEINSRTPDGPKALDAGLAFFFGFPDDPRARTLLPGLASLRWGLPEAERAAHLQAFNDRLSVALAQPDLKDSAREAILGGLAHAALGSENRAAAPNVVAVRTRIDALATRYPESTSLASLEVGYAKLLGKTDAAAGAAFMKKLAGSPNAEVARSAGAEVRVAEMRVTPLEMKFTAADGRDVDLAKLRGKVVLVDFWATWCGPCMAEMPNVKRVYEAYHERGFEIVGISFDQVPDAAAPKKYQKSREDFIAFTKEKGMSWPQYYDGTYWQNPYAVRYGINGIPAMFLLDQEGKLVETKARGEKLEAEVKRLLKL